MGSWPGGGGRASEMGRPITARESIREAATGLLRRVYGRAPGWRSVRPMEFRVLGTIEVAGPSPSPSPPGAKERAILARLLLDPGRTVPADALLEAAWDGVPREVAARSLAVRVANLRAFLEPGRDRGAPSSLLVRDGPGYRLEVAPEQVDAQRFERCVRTAATLPAAAALELLDGALALWRGPPFGELADAEFARGEVRRLEDLRSQAEEARARALVELGRPLEAVGELRRLVGLRPAARGAGRHADARALRRRPPGRGARRLPRAGRAAARAGARAGCGDARARAPHPRQRRDARRGVAAPSAEARARGPGGPRARARAAARGARRARSRAAAPECSRRASRASARARSWTRSCATPRRRAPSRASASASPSAGRASRTCRCWTRSARSRAGRPAKRSSRRWRGARRRGWWSCRGCWARASTRRRPASAPRARRARACCARCSRRSTPSALRRRSCWCSRTCTGPTTRRSTSSPRCCAAASRPGCCCSARSGRRATRRSRSSRTSSACAALCEELPVGPLAPAAVAAHLEARFPAAPLPDGLADVLARRSGGNPLFMRNLLDHWLADGTLAERAGAVALDASARAGGRRAADAARAHPQTSSSGCRPRTRSCSGPRASPGAPSPSRRSPLRSTATARRSRRAARSSPAGRA